MTYEECNRLNPKNWHTTKNTICEICGARKVRVSHREALLNTTEIDKLVRVGDGRMIRTQEK